MSSFEPNSILVRPVISERAYDMMDLNRYTFEVAKTANKQEIAEAVETLFKVKVTKVNTMSVKPKPKRVRTALGKTRTWKKAIVTLAPGESIELFDVNV